MAEGSLSPQLHSASGYPVLSSSTVLGWISRGLVAGLIVTHLLLAIFVAAKANLWVDEAYTLHTTSDSFSFAVWSALWFEMQPPLYFSLLWIFRQLGDSILIARCFSILCSLGSLLVVGALSRRLFPKVHPGWAVSLFALNPILIWAATEIRLYAFMILLSGGLMVLFHDGFLAEIPKARARWAYAGVCLLSLYTQYYLGFLILAQGVTLLCWRDWRGAGRFCLLMIIVGFLFLPMGYAVLLQVESRVESPEVEIKLLSEIAGVAYNLRSYALPVTSDWTAKVGKFFWAMLLGISLTGLFRWRTNFVTRNVLMLGLCVAIPFAFFAVLVWKIGPGSAEIRHTSLLIIPSLFLVMSLLQSIPSRKMIAVATGILLVTQLAGLSVRQAEAWAKPGDWIAVAEFLHREVKADEPIVIYTPDGAIALAPYYHGSSPLVSLPQPEVCDVYDVSQSILRSPEQVKSVLRQNLGRLPRRMWLIEAGGDEFMGVVYHREYLHQFLAKHYTEQREEKFFRCRIRSFERLSEQQREPLP